MKPKTALAGILLVAAAAKVCAQQPTVSADVSARTAYEMRGIGIDERPVALANVNVAYKACSVTGNTSYSLPGNNFTGVAGAAMCSIGTRYGIVTPMASSFMTLPDGTTVHEAGAALTLERKLSPTLLAVRSIGRPGLYIEGGVSHEQRVKGVPLDMHAAVAYNDRYFRSERGLSHLELGVDVPLRYKAVTVAPELHFCQPIYGRREAVAGLKVTFNQ